MHNRITSPPVVRVVGITKRFATKLAVDDVHLDVPAGSFFGLVGPNGAGKTTLLRTMTGLQRPDAGNVVIGGDTGSTGSDTEGYEVWPDPSSIRSRIGVLPDDLHLFERLTGRELLAYVGLIRRIEPTEVERRAGHLLDVLGFGASADDLVADYSTGMRKKVGLAAALLHAPPVLFLDEPFESVDPISVRTLQDVLRAYQQAGGTVVLSSHVMDTVERLCEHVAIMDVGKIIAIGPIDEVQGGQRLEDVFLASVSDAERSSSSLAWFRADEAASTSATAATVGAVEPADSITR